MTLKHRTNRRIPNLSLVQDEQTRKFLSDMMDVMFSTFDNIYDDLNDNDVFKLDFDNELLEIEQGLKFKRTAVSTSPYTVAMSDLILGVNTSSPRTLNLPAAATAGIGKIYIVKDETGSAGSNNITIDGNGGEKIDGAANRLISVNYDAVRLYCDGSNWFTW